MLDILGALLLSALAVALAVLGIGAVSETRKKAVGEKTDKGFISELKSYGIFPRASDQDILKINDSEKWTNLKGFAGVFEHETGYIKLNGPDSETHEKFHRAHYIETMAPTKKIRHKLSEEWTKNREIVDGIKRDLSQLPETLVTDIVREEANDAYVALSLAQDRDNMLNEIEALSNVYEKESNTLSYKEQKYYDSEKSFKEFLSKLVYSYVYSEAGAKQLENTVENQIKKFGSPILEIDELRTFAVKVLYSRLTDITAPWNDKNDTAIVKTFKEFLEQTGDVKKFEEKRDAIVDSYNQRISRLERVDDEYRELLRTYIDAKKQNYLKTYEGRRHSKSIQKNIWMYALLDFSPLTESFAYYMNVQHGDKTKETAKEQLLESNMYAKNNKERLKYEIALRTVFKLHEGVKKYGNLSDDYALKIVLPMSKYIRSVNELESFASDERNIKELVQYSTIASNMTKNEINSIASNMAKKEMDSFGEYRGLQALKHFKNDGK